MLTGKTVSLKTIIEKIYRDYGFTTEIPIESIIEWSIESMDLIGVPQAYDTKFSCISVENYRAELPYDLLMINQTREKTSKRAMRYSSDTFHPPIHCADSEDLLAPTKYEYTYKIKGNFMFTSFKTGQVELSYITYPVDECQFPLIPDNTRYIKGVESYIVHMIDRKLFRKGLIPERVFRDSEQEWLFYVASAATAAHTMSVDEMESFKNQLVRLIPSYTEHMNSFKSLASTEEKMLKNPIRIVNNNPRLSNNSNNAI